MRTLTAIILTSLILTSCMEVNTSDPVVAYKNWGGTKPPDDLKVLNGQYWQSAHWTKEYIMYLKLMPTNEWWDEFLKQNYISVDTDEWTKPSDAPKWFTPSVNSIRYGGGDDFDQGSRYFQDTLTGECYIYEIQL